MASRKDQEKQRWLEAVGKAIRGFRNELDVSQEKLGDLAGLHRTYVSDVERGRRNPTAWTLLALANTLKKKPSDIFREAERILVAAAQPDASPTTPSNKARRTSPAYARPPGSDASSSSYGTPRPVSKILASSGRVNDE